MAIAFTKYVDIISGVGGVAQAVIREYIGRIFSTNTLIPTKTLVEFTDLASVLAYFGSSASEEYKRALFYFSFVSKLTTSPKKIGFARWADADTAPLIFGEPADFLIADFNAVSDYAISITLGAITKVINAIDPSGDAALADVAATLQVDIRAADVDPLFASAVVEYDAVRKSFNLTAGATGAAVVVVANAGVGTELAADIGWLNTGTILSDGVAEETITEVLTESTEASNNFGSFLFQPAFVLADIVEAATWAKAQNVRFMFFHSVLEVDGAATEAAVAAIGATGINNKDATADEYPEMMGMIIQASTDYTRRNANTNYMFNQFDITATVTETSNSNTLDALRINYYGVTQQAGRLLNFFQRGVLMGLATDPKDMNTFANEIWLKDAMGVAVINLLLALSALQGNQTGRGQLLGILQGPIDDGLFNGTISVGKPLNDTQKAYIESVTGDAEAWRQIENIGYWLDAAIVDDTENPGELKATYLLLYSKADAIRKVDGTHTLI